jgi:branched-chain amino acid transport system substrate-binding protein
VSGVRFGRVLALAAATSLALAGCAGGSSSSGSGDSSTLKIGFMGDLTGENSGIVIPPNNGAKLAIDEYNATNPSVKLELKNYDSQGKPEQATSLVQTAIGTDKITALIGPAFSGESKAVGGVLEQGKIPSVSPSATNPGLAGNGWKYCSPRTRRTTPRPSRRSRPPTRTSSPTAVTTPRPAGCSSSSATAA